MTRYTTAEIIAFLGTYKNAVEYLQQQDQYIWTEVLIESNFSMRATERFVNALEDAFDKILADNNSALYPISYRVLQCKNKLNDIWK